MADASTIGQANVEVGADLRKMMEGLDKAKAESKGFTVEAAKGFISLNTAITAASVGLIAYQARTLTAAQGMGILTGTVTALGAGLKNVISLVGTLGTAMGRFTAAHPRMAIAATGALGGNPILGLAVALAGSRTGGALGGIAGFALRHPGIALAAGTAIGALGIAAVGAAAAAGSSGFEALKEAFNEARSAGTKLQQTLDTLKESAEKLSSQLPGGSEAESVRLRRLGAGTGGLSSDFAAMAGGVDAQVSSDVLARSGPALQEITLRMGDAQRAAEALALALRNPARAMEALREAGIQFTAEQRRQLEGMRMFEDRLKGAHKIIDIINSQTPAAARRSGFIEFMEALGRFAGGTPGVITQAITASLKSLAQELMHISGLNYVLADLDSWFRRIGESMSRLNRQLFPSGEADRIANIRDELKLVNDELDKISRTPGTTVPGLGFIENWVRQRQVAGLEGRRLELQRQQEIIDYEQMNRIVGEFDRRQRGLTERVEARVRATREELRVMRGAGSRAELEGNRLADAEGMARTNPLIREYVSNLRQIEALRRSISQAGRMTVFERENTQLTQQIQLFRFGNEEMEIRNRMLQIEMQAAQRRQQLDDAQKNALLERMRLLKEIQNLTGAINEANAALFNAMGDALAQFAVTGKFKFKEFADSVIQQMIRIALQSFVIKPILNALSGFTNAMIGEAILPGSTTGPIAMPKVGGFAAGGSFTVPGGGGGDKPYLIGLSAGERVSVAPNRGGGNAGQGVTIINNVNSSKNFEVQSTTRQGPDGQMIVEQVFTEVMRKIGRGDGDDTFGARFGVRPRTVAR